ncbi:MAG: HRDC domain-containing protein [Myxococcota bacterium]
MTDKKHPHPELISTPAALSALVDRLTPARRIALDTESDGFFRYRARLCLLQLASDDVEALVDPLALRDMAPLNALLADSTREIVLHDAEQDIALLRRHVGLTLGRVFDTSAAAKLLGIRALGLQSMLQDFLGVQLDKKEQRSDWGRRPLRPEQVSYAVLDVRYLLRLRDVLEQRLSTTGRHGYAQQEFNRIRQRVLVERPADLEAWRNLQGAKTLDPTGRGVLRAVFLWREQASAARDVAPFRLLSPETLVELARRRPTSRGELGEVRGVPQSVAGGQDADALLAAIREATPVTGPLLPPRPPETEEDRVLAARFEALRAWRAGVATQWGVDVGVIGSNALLKTLARLRPTTRDELSAVEDLLPWQLEQFGESLLTVLRTPVQPVPSRDRRGRVPSASSDPSVG